MLPFHSLPQHLTHGQNSVAFYALNPARKLIIFVHGFGGGSIRTWDPMHRLLPLQPQSDGWDIVFYGYGSVGARALNSANLLRQSLDALATSRTSTNGGAYTDVLIVAHSLGALIARQCVLDALRMRLAWAQHTRLLLFGPAHCGASLTNLASALLATGGMMGVLSATVLQFASPVLQDLQVGSAFVTKVARDTTAALRTRKKAPLIADAVLFGVSDRVVQVLNFCADPPSLAIRGQGHMNVCRPRGAYRDPLTHVVNHL